MTDSPPTFEQLGLNSQLLKAIKDVGYETPSPIQAMSIPPLLEGRDIIGQAQTGTGKTGAFALPILNNLDVKQKTPQVLVLAPTRELAIQVAEAFQTYANHMKGFHILPVYGGQGYETQLRALKRGVHVVVGTPGRVMDHIRKGALKLDGLTHLVLDEADEMLRMGFIDDVEWVMERTPQDRQIALFSATMPPVIAKVAKKYLTDPVLVKIEAKVSTAETIRQRYWPVGGVNKLEAITRILEAESFEAMIIFVRTKTATVDLAERLEARGYRSSALNGDISQNLRERTITRLKNGQIDILVATDVAARGLDVERISHVLNYDIPYDTESYVHRIGRTGRAGRTGDAILFVAKREIRMLRAIERATGQSIEPMALPSAAQINEQRVAKFKQKISDTLSGDVDLGFFKKLISDHMTETGDEAEEIAAALAKLCQGDQPLLVSDKKQRNKRTDSDFSERSPSSPRERSPRDRDDRSRDDRSRRERKPREITIGERAPRERNTRDRSVDIAMDTYKVSVGHNDGVKPGDLVGAIANEAGMDSQHIGQIKIQDDHSTIDLPSGMPKEIHQILQRVWVCQKQLKLALMDGDKGSRTGGKFAKPKRGATAEKPKRRTDRAQGTTQGHAKP